MKAKALSRVLTIGVLLLSLPACFMNQQGRLGPLPPPPVREAKTAATSTRLPYVYSDVQQYHTPKKPAARVVVRVEERVRERPPVVEKPEKIVPPPLDLPIESNAKRDPIPEIRVGPIEKPANNASSKVVVPEEHPQTVPVSTAVADSPLVQALRHCYDKRPNAALDSLKSMDALNQEVLLTLLPITVRMSEGSLAQADPQEVAIILDQLQTLITTLQPKATLRLEQLTFCKNIRKFGVFEPMDGKPAFRAGDMVEIYGELRNISSERHQSKFGEFRTRTQSTLEIREAGGNSGWRKEVPKAELSKSALHDFYHHYRFQLPELTPGPYVLSVEVTDVPTGRKARQKLEFRVMP
jgi:hypothetical protein